MRIIDYVFKNRHGVALILLLSWTCMVIPGCFTMQEKSDSSEIPDPYSFKPELREWYDVIHNDVKDNVRSVERVGYVYKQIKRDDHVYFVRDLRYSDVGFILKDFQAFLFTKDIDITGTEVQSTEFLGNFGLEGGVKKILGLSSGEVELRKATEGQE